MYPEVPTRLPQFARIAIKKLLELKSVPGRQKIVYTSPTYLRGSFVPYVLRKSFPIYPFEDSKFYFCTVQTLESRLALYTSKVRLEKKGNKFTMYIGTTSSMKLSRYGIFLRSIFNSIINSPKREFTLLQVEENIFSNSSLSFQEFFSTKIPFEVRIKIHLSRKRRLFSYLRLFKILESNARRRIIRRF